MVRGWSAKSGLRVLVPSKDAASLSPLVTQDLFPSANLGLGPKAHLPYSYDAFVIAARYFPQFGTEAPTKVRASLWCS